MALLLSATVLPLRHDGGRPASRCGAGAGRRRRRQGLRAAVLAASAVALLLMAAASAAAFVPPPCSSSSPRIPGPILSAGSLVTGVWAFAAPSMAAETAAAPGTSEPWVRNPFDNVNWGDSRNYPFFAFYLVLGLYFIKNNFIDFNGPLAGMFGMQQASCEASHILVPSEEKALELLGQLTANGSSPSLEEFSALATENSTCPSKNRGGNLGGFSEGSMVTEFNAVCFDEDNELGVPHGPVKTKFGYHLIWITKRTLVKADA